MSGSNPAKNIAWLRTVLVALGVALFIVLIFGAGFYVGRQSAIGFRPGINSVQVRSRGGHGAIGMIQSIEGQKIIIQSRDGKTQVIRVDENTRLEKKFQKASLADFKINEQVVAIGSPNSEGEIQARLVGVVDQPFRPPRSILNENDSR